jgi:F-type H+-transporting ATPase subunit b
MAKAMEERAQLLKDARETRDRIVNEAKELAKAEANKIIQDANASIHQQKMAAITDLKNQVGNLVVEVSEKILRRELANRVEQEAYIGKLTEEVKFN